MRRETLAPRPDAIEKVEHLGLTFHTVDGQPYWNESAAYAFEPAEIAVLEKASNDLHALCLEAVERVIVEDHFARLQIPEAARPVVVQAWEDDPPAMYGRFDLVFDGQGAPKLLEYNADTPTSLLEAAVVQWHWLQDVRPEADQFNSIWEGLVEKWRALKGAGYLNDNVVHFGCMDAPEDLMTCAVLMDAAHEVGLRVEHLGMHEIGWDQIEGRFVNRDQQPIQTLFKLYPWEWLLRDEFGPMALKSYRRHQWIEPIWKMILSNKAILALLWEFFPDHPNLLPAYLEGPRELTAFVSKPFLGREGEGVALPGQTGSGDGPVVYQAHCPLPIFDGSHAVIGSWIIDGEARGIGIRESDGPVTDDLARFVPHYFLPETTK